MKISIRLTLFSIIITAVAIFFCCGILITVTAHNHIDSAVSSGIAELKMLSNSFYREIDVVVEDEPISESAKSSLVLYVFRKYTTASVSGAHYILSNGEETVYNDCLIDPRPLLPDLKKNSEKANSRGISDKGSELWPYMIIETERHKYLAVGHYSSVVGDKLRYEHEIYLVRDITGVYNGIAKLGIGFAAIAFITILLCAITLVALIHRTMRPLGALRDSAAALADGQYHNRIQVFGKDEIAELGVSFNKMADSIDLHIIALKDTAEQRKLLLSALTHELKTPMTAIIGYSEALLKIRLSEGQREECAAYVNRECRRLERLSQKMMQLVTLQNGEPLDIKKQPVSALYDAVRETLLAAAKKENILLVFKAKCNPVFNMDIDMMASVLINLFDNGRKARAKNIFVESDNSGIVVQDDGQGIPENEIPNVTQPFYMVDKSYSQSIGGSGLGLAICSLILNAHGAQMHIESQLGKGTSVKITFP